MLGRRTAALGDLCGDLRPHLGPEVTVARGGEGAQLDGAVGADELDRLDRTAGLVDLEPQLAVGLRGDQERAEVDALDVVGREVLGVEGTVGQQVGVLPFLIVVVVQLVEVIDQLVADGLALRLAAELHVRSLPAPVLGSGCRNLQ